MNILDIQNKLRDFSEENLIQEMQLPSGQVPQFLVLNEITRRQKMKTAFAGAQGQDESTVADDMIAAAGIPAEFAGQMAGAMAPNTDMEGNYDMPTDEVPMGSEPVQGMAGGGLVALSGGGRVGGREPNKSMVIGGILHILNDNQEWVPWGPVSQIPNGQNLFPESTFPPDWSEREDPPMSVLYPPNIRDTGSRGRIPPVQESGLGHHRLFPPQDEPRMTTGVGLREQLPPLAWNPFTGLQLSGPREDFTPPESTFFAHLHTGPGYNVRHNSGASGPVYPRAAELPYVSDLLPPEGDPTSEVEPEVPTEMEDQSSDTPTSIRPEGGGSGGGSGGGIAGVAAASQQAVTPYEQELLDMLKARERRAEQDKWLALAQFGLQLMSSNNPTFGGAVGEAGVPAIDTIRESRDSYDADRLGLLNLLEQHRMGQAQLALQQQAAAARSRAGGGTGGFKSLPVGVITRLMDEHAAAQDDLNRLPPVPQGGWFGQRQDPNAQARVAAQQRADRAAALLNLASMEYGFPLAGVGDSYTESLN